MIGDSLGSTPNLLQKDLITVMYLSKAGARTCLFSKGDLAEEISSASVFSLPPSQNIY